MEVLSAVAVGVFLLVHRRVSDDMCECRSVGGVGGQEMGVGCGWTRGRGGWDVRGGCAGVMCVGDKGGGDVGGQGPLVLGMLVEEGGVVLNVWL